MANELKYTQSATLTTTYAVDANKKDLQRTITESRNLSVSEGGRFTIPALTTIVFNRPANSSKINVLLLKPEADLSLKYTATTSSPSTPLKGGYTSILHLDIDLFQLINDTASPISGEYWMGAA